MSSIAEVRAHLKKAQEFLDAAKVNADLELFNAAASAAVTSGINAKDAICLALTGRSNKTDAHADAVAELKAAHSSLGGAATTLGRLLRLKSKSQYQSVDVAKSDASKAIEWAARLVDTAVRVVV